MKRTILFLLCFTTLYHISAQNTWNVEINCGGGCLPYNLIKTNDDNILLLVRKSIEEDGFLKLKHYMIKYNLDGEVLWEKEYDFGLSEPYSSAGNWGGVRTPSTIIQTANNDFISSGKYYESGAIFYYKFKTNSTGDSLLFQKFDSENGGCIYPRFVIDSKLYAFGVDSITQLYKITEISDYFDIEYEAPLENSNEYWIRSIIDNDLNIYTEKGNSETKFRKYSIEGELLEEKTHVEQCSLLSISSNGYLTSYYKGLLQLNSDLSKRWYIEEEDILSTPLTLEAQFLVPTDDGGFIMGGNAFDNIALQWVYLVKVDSEGTKEWGYTYDPFYLPLTHLEGLIEVEDGYILTGISEYSGISRLIKFNKQGVYTATNEIENSFADQVFPNPAHHFINIRFQNAFNGILSIFSMGGKQLFQISLQNESSFSHAIESFPAGMFTIQLINEKTNQLKTVKFVKY